MDRLNAEVMKAFRSLPQRAVEVGGILLGRIEDDGRVAIDDFTLIPCDHRRGPSYTLSEADRQRLARALGRVRDARQVAGFFRSHTRRGLYLDQDDWSVVAQHFSRPAQVVLLVRPNASPPATAGFFLWEEESMQRQATPLEFPFSAGEVHRQPGAVIETSAPLGPERPPAPSRTAPAPVRVRFPARWRVAGPIALALAGALSWGGFALNAHRREAAASAQPKPSLRIDRSGGSLRVSWNPNAPAVRKAERGALSITDGNVRRRFELSPSQLLSGGALYDPAEGDVSVRLELVHGRASVVAESRSVAPVLPNRPRTRRTPVFYGDGL